MILWAGYIIAEILIQSYLIEKKNWKPVYFQLFIFRAMAAIVHGIYLDVTPETWWPVITFQVCSFWILFDLGLNLARGKKWYYRGNTSGWLDSLPEAIYWNGKVMTLAIGIVAFIKGVRIYGYI